MVRCTYTDNSSIAMRIGGGIWRMADLPISGSCKNNGEIGRGYLYVEGVPGLHTRDCSMSDILNDYLSGSIFFGQAGIGTISVLSDFSFLSSVILLMSSTL